MKVVPNTRRSLKRFLKKIREDEEPDLQYTTEFKKLIRNMVYVSDNIYIQDNGPAFKAAQFNIPLLATTKELYVKSIYTMAMRFSLKKLRGGSGSRYEVSILGRASKSLSAATLTVINDALNKLEFNPACGVKADLKEVPRISSHPTYSIPDYSKGVMQILALASKRTEDIRTYSLWSAFRRCGNFLATTVTGMIKSHYWLSLNKLHANIVAPTENIIDDLYLAVLKLHYRWGTHNKPPLALDLSYSKVLLDMSSLNTSAGILPCDMKVLTPNGIQSKQSASKKQVNHIAAAMVEKYVEDVRAYVAGELTDPPSLVFLEKENLKNEILKWVAFFDGSYSQEAIFKAMNKVRIFYITNAAGYGLDKGIFEAVNNVSKYYQNAIGIKPQGGGFHIIWDILTCAEGSPVCDHANKLYDKWHKRGVDITKRQYGEGDYGKYDTTLLAAVLAFVASLAVPLYVPTEKITEPMLKYILREFIFHTVYKTMYIAGLGEFWDIWGCMFSGKYITSIGDTLYQMLLFLVYKAKLIEKYGNDELLMDLLTLVFFYFYGDDHIGSWPVLINEYPLYDDSENFLIDFVSFCCCVAGMQYKKEAHYVTFEPYAESFFVEVTPGRYKMVKHCQSVSFLQNQMTRVHVNDQYVITMPYRSTEDFYLSVARSLKATKDPHSYQGMIMARARLYSGNLEAYSVCREIYQASVELFGAIPEDKFDQVLKTLGKDSNAFYLMRDAAPVFPSLLSLCTDQCQGWHDGSGLPAKTAKGHRAKG
jgi:hypothetical protein